MSSIGVVIPHYYKERESSLKHAISALKKQSAPPEEIIVWNNDDSILPLGEDVRVIDSPRNIGPFARFFAALTASTDYVFFQDNDLALHPNALENLLTWTKKRPGILSLHGYNIPPGGSYAKRSFVLNVQSLTRVNLTLGRAELVPWSTIPRALLRLKGIPRMDDLWFSARCRDMRVPIFVVPTTPSEQIYNLPGWNGGASAEPDHYKEREKLFAELFPAMEVA